MNRFLKLAGAAFLGIVCLIAANASIAATCSLTGSACTDGPSTKSISGYPVTRACWKYTDTYSCVGADSSYSCQPLKDLSCGITNSVCSSTAFNGTCLYYTNTYMCTDKVLATPLPAMVALLSTSYRITNEKINDTACGTSPASATCELTNETCTDAGPIKTVNGLEISRDCWKWNRNYKCVNTSMTSDCGKFSSNPSCKETGSHCVEYMGSICQVVEHTYSCTTGGAGTTVTSSCDTQKYCMGAACFNTGYAADTKFGSSVSGMEIMRQAGFYMDPATQQIFKGAPYYCEKKLFGLSNCCNTDGGGAGMNNSSLVAKAGGSALKFGAEYIKNVGSPYMFDMMYSSDMPWLVDMAYEAMWGSTWASTGTVELYGLTFEITGGLGYSSVTLVGFDPTSLAISLAVMVVMDMLACTNDEKLLALKRGQNLCVYAGDQCTSKFLGACVTRQQTYCCYNSRLGKLVATGAGAQLGRPPSSGNCAGFTAGDLQKVDFSKIDFSEFIAEIAPTSKSAAYATQRGQDKMQSYFAP